MTEKRYTRIWGRPTMEIPSLETPLVTVLWGIACLLTSCCFPVPRVGSRALRCVILGPCKRSFEGLRGPREEKQEARFPFLTTIWRVIFRLSL